MRRGQDNGKIDVVRDVEDGTIDAPSGKDSASLADLVDDPLKIEFDEIVNDPPAQVF